MQQKITLKLLPSEAQNESIILERIAQFLSQKISAVSGFQIIKKSIDARGKNVWIHLLVNAYVDEPVRAKNELKFAYKNVKHAAKKVIIIGGGPAGIFAALQLIENGVKPIILERGKDVRARRRDLAILNKEGIINPESNYCFGEGGAGTYSDGKLYTRSNKRGDVNRILNLFVHFGASENILSDAHPHIGTNKLPAIITEMRKQILDCGGEFHFEKKVIDFVIEKDEIKAVKTADGDCSPADSFILATGHSARDIFHLLHQKKLQIFPKPFALGVRVEHPQELINFLQYGKNNPQQPFLPPASYSLVQQVDGRGVFSFCMCPGGIIAPASTNENELVVNGWSPSKRNNPYANSGMVVQLEIEDVIKYNASQPNWPTAGDSFVMMDFQRRIEQRAYEMGGGNFAAPAQRMVDFTQEKLSSSLPACSYLPGIHSASISEILPSFVNDKLKKALRQFGKRFVSKNKQFGYFTNEAVLVATESRTSSPVRIPRNEKYLHHPQIKNLFPCGEGAGYAGGILSAAMDGERVALACCR